MNVLIAGGAGFIGSHLAERYIYRRDGQHRASGTGKQTRCVGEVVEALVQLVGAPDVDPVRRVPSVAKLEALVGYRPKTPIQQVFRMVAEQMQPNFEQREAESTP